MQAKHIADREVLTELAGADRTGAWDRLCTRYPPKVVAAKFERLVSRGLLDCGVSIKFPWLTPKGRAALEADDA